MTQLDSVVISFNCGREFVKPAVFSDHLYRALPSGVSPAILVLALQEVAPIAHSFLGGSYLAPYLNHLHAAVDLTAKKWNNGSYAMIMARNVGMTAIMVLARQDVRDRLEGLATGGVGVGWYEMGNKGAVAVNVKIRASPGEESQDQQLSLTFVAAHLAPMEWQLERRNEDWKNIVQGLVLMPATATRSKSSAHLAAKQSDESMERRPLLGDNTDGDENLTESSERDGSGHPTKSQGIYASGTYTIVAGDLNYRTSSVAPRPSSRAMFPRLSMSADSPQHYMNLLTNDQLTAEIKASRTLQGFQEAPITFAPTYKYSKTAQDAAARSENEEVKASSSRLGSSETETDRGLVRNSSTWDFPWSTHRWPSWCDRVLWLASSNDIGSGRGIQAAEYVSMPLMSTSDHQPVVLHFSIPWSDSDPQSNLRDRPPFAIDPHWRSRRAVARRLEVVTGLAAYLSTTWEGRALILAIAVGTAGGWLAMRQLLV